jgi:hypothetical protein
MKNNSLVGTYAYGNTGKALHAPSTVTRSSGPVQTLSYDLNGNMTNGLDGKVMTYNLENRPLSVTFAGKKTRLTSTAPTAPGGRRSRTSPPPSPAMPPPPRSP